MRWSFSGDCYYEPDHDYYRYCSSQGRVHGWDAWHDRDIINMACAISIQVIWNREQRSLFTCVNVHIELDDKGGDVNSIRDLAIEGVNLEYRISIIGE